MAGDVCCVTHSAGRVCALATLGWRLQGNCPKWGHEGVDLLEDRLSIMGDGDAGDGEAGGTAMVAEESDGKEDTRVEMWEDVVFTGGG